MLARHLAAVIAVFGVVLATTGHASTVWNESTHGDAGGAFTSAIDLGTLSGGGSFDIFGSIGGGDGMDYFKFTTTTAFTVDAPVATLQAGNPSTGFPLYNADRTLNLAVSLTGPANNVFGSLLAGTYFLRPAELSLTPTTYKLTIITELAAVPLPAALPFLATGLCGLGFMARRRRKAV